MWRAGRPERQRMAGEREPPEPGSHEKVPFRGQASAEQDPEDRRSVKSLPARLARAPWLLLLLLLSLGLCFLLLVTTLVQVSRTDQCPQGDTRGQQESHSLVADSHDGKPLGLEQVHQQLSQINASLAAVSHDCLRSGLEQIQQQLSQINASLARLCRPCPWTWQPFQGSCYLFSRTLGSWETSASSCLNMGAHLVIINSAEEQRFLRYWDIRKNERTWIGLNDKNTEASWRWVDNTHLQLSFWIDGEPNNVGDEDCVELFEDGWNDSKCTSQNFWVCEQPSLPCPGL